jgi:hypothetical protein
MADHTPMAVARSLTSVKTLRRMLSVAGIIMAPPAPSSARAAMSISGDVASAAAVEATPNTTAPISSSRRRPMRSPNPPMVTSSPARTKP